MWCYCGAAGLSGAEGGCCRLTDEGRRFSFSALFSQHKLLLAADTHCWPRGRLTLHLSSLQACVCVFMCTCVCVCGHWQIRGHQGSAHDDSTKQSTHTHCVHREAPAHSGTMVVCTAVHCGTVLSSVMMTGCSGSLRHQ